MDGLLVLKQWSDNPLSRNTCWLYIFCQLALYREDNSNKIKTCPISHNLWTPVNLCMSFPSSFLSSSVSAFTKKPKSQSVEVGAKVVFEAQSEKEDTKVRWQRDTKDITGSDKYTISAEGNKHSLTISNAAPEDAGGYAVIAGGSKVKFELKIKEAEGGSPKVFGTCAHVCILTTLQHHYAQFVHASSWHWIITQHLCHILMHCHFVRFHLTDKRESVFCVHTRSC